MREGEPVASGWTAIPASGTAAALAHGGFQVVCADMQHGMHDERSLIDSIQAIHRAGKSPAARVPVGRFDLVSRVLDAGAQFVIAPMINTEEDAKAFAAAAKYPSIGARSWGPAAAMDLWGVTPREYLQAGNELVVALAMIETKQALHQLDAILAVPGIDGVFVGPSDLSITVSNGGQIDPRDGEVLRIAREIAVSARGADKIAGVYAFDVEKGQQFVESGFNFVAIGSDLLALKDFAGRSSALIPV